jgi:hypothetical protein
MENTFNSQANKGTSNCENVVDSLNFDSEGCFL